MLDYVILPLELLLVILLLPCVVEILQFGVYRTHMLQQITDEVDIGVG